MLHAAFRKLIHEITRGVCFFMNGIASSCLGHNLHITIYGSQKFSFLMHCTYFFISKYIINIVAFLHIHNIKKHIRNFNLFS